eukprot:TRINITY_DN551_c0_g2_i1.p2 TRINITY_DN551_c0_g2~~TRINITY_DN551_c0_g2_i1.p2  ORF type:complete len:888 (+),score=332.25 TRINITY_DN551_c0_g2_i1:49-2712(+)
MLSCVRLLTSALAAAAAGAAFPPAQDDVHYPAEERQERAGLAVPAVLQVTPAGAVLASQGQNETCGVGGTAFGWVVLDVGADGVVVMEYDFKRWGMVAYASPAGVVRTFRKGVGLTSAIERPLYDLRGWRADYWARAYGDADDYIKQLVLNETGGEPTFAAFASAMAPKEDYGLVAHKDSATKFSVSTFGHIKTGNFTPLYTPPVGRNESAGVNVLFDPRNYTSYWPPAVAHQAGQPDQTLAWTDVKTARLGGHLSALTLGAWHRGDEKGFQMAVVPNVTHPGGEVLVRIGEPAGAGVPVTHYEYMSVLGVDPAHEDAVTRLADGGRFYAALLAHAAAVDEVLVPGGTFDVDLQYGAEGQRLMDMARAAMVDSWSIFEGLEPNYGTGVYWGGGFAGSDHGALYLETESLDQPLLLYGATAFAAERVAFYLKYFIHDADGVTPASVPSNVPGRPGTIDWHGWKTYCPWDGFADGLADYGRLLQLYVDTATAMTHVDGGAWAAATWPRVNLTARYILELRQNATNASAPAGAQGMLRGPAEHDTCTQPEYYFSINFFFWRGMVVLGRYLVESGTDAALGAALTAEAAAYKADLTVALDAAVVRLPSGGLFIPPYVNTTGPFAPFHTMIESTDAEYSNFRYYSEMLMSQFLNASMVTALSGFREAHSATLSGINRYADHLDDMPSVGYALTDLLHNRLESFWALLFGHTANYQARGTFGSSEQLAYLGDGYTASIRERIGDIDLAFCVPSASLVSIMLRWAVALEHPDVDELYLLRGAPHRWYAAPIAASHAATRFGTAAVSTGAFDAARRTQAAHVALALHGAGYHTAGPLTVTVKVLDPSGATRVAAATVSSPAVAVAGVDAETGVVTLLVAGRPTGDVAFDVAASFA